MKTPNKRDLHKQHVNVIILASIPIDKNLKRYYRKMFEKMVENNGSSFACDRFKLLKETLMGYRSDKKRHEHLSQWLTRSGFHVNGWLKKVFRYMDTQPEYIMQFVKIYCGPNEPNVSIGEAAESQHRTLQKASAIRSSTPVFMTRWLHHVCREKPLDRFGYGLFKLYPETYCPDWMKAFVTSHDYETYREYLSKWKHALWVYPISEAKAKEDMVRFEPLPEMYVDYDCTGVKKMIGSTSLEEDLWNFVAMENTIGLPYEEGGCGLSYASWRFVANNLNPLWMMALGDDEVLLGYKPQKASMLDGTFVGHIHHIPKKGTVKRRSIAAPNRFIQMGLAPVDDQLSCTLKALNRGSFKDCTYDQTRLNGWLVNRVSNEALYCGSVDLHQATDHLPFEWMKTIWKELYSDRVSPAVQTSWNLFVEVSEGAWENCGYRDRWTIGQPLGALPSFRCLGLTHNLLLESLSFTLGYAHSPYCVLGDDVVITSRKLRKEYIKLMNNVGVPLSLNKSYDENLVEFAGQVFIKNLAPFYNTDHRVITWNSLFDYQMATGVTIPWGSLPKRLRKKVQRICSEEQIPKSDSEKVYGLALAWLRQPRGSHLADISVKGLSREVILEWFEKVTGLLAEDKIVPDPTPRTGIVPVCGHPVTYLQYGYADKHGYKLRYRQIDSDWYKTKYRPVASDKMIRCASAALAAVTRDLNQIAH